MTTTFPGWIVRNDDDGRNTASLENLDESILDNDPEDEHDETRDTTIRVGFSSINYKDALALHGRPGVIRRTPLIPGIDLTGEIIRTGDSRWKAGDVVTLNGAGIGEEHHGGLAGLARVGGDNLVAVPDAFTSLQATAIGTAGFTSALSLLALERHGLAPAAGPVLVTGAGGGSGSIAVALLASSGYEVVAATGRPGELADRLANLGAAEIIDRAELEQQTRPLGTQRWAGVIDSAGGSILAGALATLRHGGVAAAFGLAAGSQLPTTVLPFILRGTALLGVDSVRTGPELRRAAWNRLAKNLDPVHLDAVIRTVPLHEAKAAAEDLLAGHGTGRTVVEVARN